ncbi:MAG: hypothetical protein VYA30_00690 [Myxococcota bacterium]|nr:hypothetical protein [Myxococcota bacterium]
MMGFRAFTRLIPMMALLGCGSMPVAKFDEQRRHLFEQVGKSPRQWAEMGWWHYLADEAASAKDAFSKANQEPLALLGRAQMALDQAHVKRANALLAAIPETGLVGRIAKRLRQEKDDQLEAEINPQWVWTGSVSPWPHLGLHHLKGLNPVYMPSTIKYGENQVKLGAQQPKSGVHFGLLKDGQMGHCEVLVKGPFLLWNQGFKSENLLGHPSASRWYKVRLNANSIFAFTTPQRPKIRCFPDLGEHMHLSKQGPRIDGRRTGPNWVLKYLDGLDAVTRHQGDQALRILEGMPDTSAFSQLAARAYGTVNNSPRSVVYKRQINLWKRADARAPRIARLNLAMLYLDANESKKAYSILQSLKAISRPSQRFHRLMIVTLDQLGHRRRVRDYLERHGGRCEHLELRQRLLSYGQPDELVERLVSCGKNEHAVDLLLQYFRPADALKQLRSEPIITDEQRVLEARCERALLGAEDPQPDRPETVQELDLNKLSNSLKRTPQMAFDEAARAWVLSRITDPDALNIMSALDQWSPLSHLYLDTETRIERHQSTASKESTVRLLDHSILVFDSEGKSLRRVHEIIYLANRSAAEKYAELGLPDDAVPVAIYTRKQDGRILFAQSSPNKDSLTLPQLDRRDYIVAIYLEPNSDSGTSDGQFMSQRTYFGDYESDIQEQRFDVVVPENAEVRVESRFNAPVAKKMTIADQNILRFETNNLKAIRYELRGPKAEAVIPSVRLASRLDQEQQLNRLRDGFIFSRAQTDQVLAWISDGFKPKSKTPDFNQILRRVRQRFDGSTGLVGHRVTHGLYDGVGHRTTALSAVLDGLGISHRVLLAGPKLKPAYQDFAQLNDFSDALIKIENGPWLYPGADGAPAGYLPFHLLGGSTVQVWPPTAGWSLGNMPEHREITDQRSVRMQARIMPNGDIQGRVIDELIGAEAIAIGGMLERLTDEEKPRLFERVLIKAIASGRIQNFEINRGGQQDDTKLVLTYDFIGKMTFPNRIGCFPIQPGRTFAPLKSRRTPLYLNLPVDQVVKITLETPEEIIIDSKSDGVSLGGHRFERTITRDGQKTEIRCALVLEGQHIHPKGYGDFRNWSYQVDQLEYLNIVKPSRM